MWEYSCHFKQNNNASEVTVNSMLLCMLFLFVYRCGKKDL